MKLFLQLFVNGLVNGALYAILAVGFGMVWRTLRIFHIAYGGLFVLCAYFFNTLVTKINLGFGVAFVFTLFFAALTGWLMEIAFYRRFHNKKALSDAVLIASLGVFVIMENLTAMIFGNDQQIIPQTFFVVWHIGPIILTHIQALQFTICVLTLIILWGFVHYLRVFKALWAMGDQPDLIPVLGLPVHLLRSILFILSTILVAIPASLINIDIGTNPHVGMHYLLIAVVAVLVGGTNSYAGWLFGSLVVAILQSTFLWKFSTHWIDLATFSFLVIMLVFRPQGLFEITKRMEEIT